MVNRPVTIRRPAQEGRVGRETVVLCPGRRTPPPPRSRDRPLKTSGSPGPMGGLAVADSRTKPVSTRAQTTVEDDEDDEDGDDKDNNQARRS